MMTKIDIFSGFLGAGKTTLIKKLMEEAYAGEKLVLIENEFGEIGIDGGFLKEAGVEITEMNSGCICCSLVGDFGKALEQVLADYRPDRILIEPSGVGKLSDVITAVTKLQLPDVKLNSFTTVADASKCKIYAKNFGEFYDNQLEHAACIVLSRAQNLSAEKLAGAIRLVKEKNPDATIIATPWDQLSGKQIQDAMEHRESLGGILRTLAESAPEEHHHGGEAHHHAHGEQAHDHGHDHPHEDTHGPGCSCGCHDHPHDHHHHHADEVFQSWGRETARQFDRAELERILAELDTGRCGDILRAKGMVAESLGGWLFFDYVPGEHDIRAGSAQVIGRLCVIGAKLDERLLSGLFGLED